MENYADVFTKNVNAEVLGKLTDYLATAEYLDTRWGVVDTGKSGV